MMSDKSQIEPEIMNRKELLALCAKILQKLDKKISGRYRPNENEALYLQTIRALSSFVDVTNKILKDSEIEELEDRIKELETKQQKEKIRECV
ncbi:hypothetical protein [Methanoplanus limicola]|uniref:DUF8136 domain-containing protein n=1 Tax=Methanoplanus limicola DSM 2279 TaxID=937775 RepID=H1Z3M6_9EURY|nr:hypothetical protein [Methanoplanus limicola]EHQ35625.1 hypothetical protein Metlim_1524 [Methanoplanus limicola DSM 2279]